jgi:hypothetical protein
MRLQHRSQGGHLGGLLIVSTGGRARSIGIPSSARVTVNALLPEDRTDIAARVVCLIELFGEPGRNEVSARVAAIDWRFQALARLSMRPEFKNWSLPVTFLEAAASEPLTELDGQPGFDADRFFKRLLAMTEEEGHG